MDKIKDIFSKRNPAYITSEFHYREKTTKGIQQITGGKKPMKKQSAQARAIIYTYKKNPCLLCKKSDQKQGKGPR